MIALIPYINLLNLFWIIKCLFFNNMEPLIELTVAWQNSKPVHISCKIHAFLQNAISFALLYSGFV